MQKDYEALHHKLEAGYWFFVSRRDVIKRLIRDEARASAVLEIGCASGVLIEELKQSGFASISGVDVSEAAIEACHKKGIKEALLIDGTHLPYPDGRFEVLITSDVLEHIEDDGGALREWARVLKPGGKMILLVPAWQFLWSDHDLANKHFRRYGRGELVSKIKAAGFEVARVSYWNFILFVPIVIFRAMLKLLPKGKQKTETEGNLYGGSAVTNAILRSILMIENKLIEWGVNLPFGVSLLVVAKKK